MRIAGVFALLAAAGCRGEPSAPPGASEPWAAMDRTERVAHMTAVVMPRMKALFQAHDPARYATFTCATCHGAGVADGTYTMPNPALLQLVSKGFRREIYLPHQAMVRFMWSEVQPTMAELLGVRESRFGRGAGFNCRGCHVRKDG
jgi:hypothetical protein